MSPRFQGTGCPSCLKFAVIIISSLGICIYATYNLVDQPIVDAHYRDRDLLFLCPSYIWRRREREREREREHVHDMNIRTIGIV